MLPHYATTALRISFTLYPEFSMLEEGVLRQSIPYAPFIETLHVAWRPHFVFLQTEEMRIHFLDGDRIHIQNQTRRCSAATVCCLK